MRRLPQIAAAVALATCTSLASGAATPIVLVSGSPKRLATPRPATQKPDGISYSDCTADDQLTFTVSLTDATGLSLEVWVGESDCVVPDGGVDSKCAQLPSNVVSADGGKVTVKVRDIVVARQVDGAIGVCESTVGALGGDADDVTLTFLLVDPVTKLPPAGLVTGTWKTSIDLAGPPVPMATATTRDGSLLVSWPATKATDLASYQVYCDDKAIPMDGGGCSSTLATEAIPSATQNTCATTSDSAATHVTVPDLTNLQSYAVAVAATDTIGNHGKLSKVDCATPAPVQDFFEAYRLAGGQGGGGCGCRLKPAPVSAIAPLCALLALGALGAQRRRLARRFRSVA